MPSTPPTRREFVTHGAAALGGGWLWLKLPAVAALSACAREAARRRSPFQVLSPDEAATMRALAARIIPSDDALPGAEEAGAVWFVDGALAELFPGMTDPLREGLADLERRSLEAHGVALAVATPEQQDALIEAVVDTPFFFVARMLTVAGVFADPRYGGNRQHASHALLGIEHRAAYQPPFGWYDAQGGAS